uniref:Uncharacterized protein n=1 Tax=Arundo donax TaxID=35708 RepID=A0A0A9BJ67_ARUDO
MVSNVTPILKFDFCFCVVRGTRYFSWTMMLSLTVEYVGI